MAELVQSESAPNIPAQEMGTSTARKPTDSAPGLERNGSTDISGVSPKTWANVAALRPRNTNRTLSNSLGVSVPSSSKLDTTMDGRIKLMDDNGKFEGYIRTLQGDERYFRRTRNKDDALVIFCERTEVPQSLTPLVSHDSLSDHAISALTISKTTSEFGYLTVGWGRMLPGVHQQRHEVYLVCQINVYS